MTNTNNLKLAKNISRYASIGFGLWLLCCFCCFSSSVSSMVSIFKSLQSLPGEVVEYGDPVNENAVSVLKSDKIAYIKLYKECEDTEHVTGIEIKLDALGEDDGGEITTENGVYIKKFEMNNVSFDLTYTLVYQDDHEETKEIEVGNVSDYTWTLGCPSQETEPHEVHGKIMYAKDVKINWKPRLTTGEEPQIEGYSIKNNSIYKA